MYAVSYSEKSVALFGPAPQLSLVKDHLKQRFSAKYNPQLVCPATGEQKVRKRGSSCLDMCCKCVRIDALLSPAALHAHLTYSP